MTNILNSPVARLLTAATVAVAGSFIGDSAADAEASESDAASTLVSPMYFVPMTTDNAAAAGYEVREGPDGTLYGVPIGTPEGSHEREVRIGGVAGTKARGTISGNCGYSSVDFLSRSVISTSYRINPSYGLPVSHNWRITYSSPIDLAFQDFSGIPSWGSQSWSTTASVRGQALKGQKLTAMASGSVLTSWGYCSSGNPVDTITF